MTPPLTLPPGDPEALATLARALRPLAATLTVARATAAAEGAGLTASWRGPAGDAAAAGARAVATRLAGAGTAVEEVATGLARLADALTEARALVSRLQRELDAAAGLTGPTAAAEAAEVRSRVGRLHAEVLDSLAGVTAGVRAAVGTLAAGLPGDEPALRAALHGVLPVLRDHPDWVRVDLREAAHGGVGPVGPAGRAVAWERSWAGA